MTNPPGRAVIIGNSDGIGLALTRRLLADGWTVTGVSRRGVDLDDDRYTHTVADVTGPDFPSHLPGVDVCVYAAGIGEFLDLDDLPAQTRTIEVNLMGLARTVEAVVPGMAAAGRGHLIGLSSLADAGPSAIAPAYAASKAGMTTYLQGLGQALRPHGVRVTAVRFGFVDTKMAKSAVKPGLITVNRAVEVLLRAMDSRAATVSYPRRIAAAARVLATASRLTRR